MRVVRRGVREALAALVLASVAAAITAQNPLPGFQRSRWFGEQVCVVRPAESMRAVINAPATLDPKRPTRLVLFATPNGNTAEHTLGARKAPGRDWHYDIQHVAAQVRRLREVDASENIVLAVVEPTPLSWPAWRAKRGGAGAGIRAIVDAIRARLPDDNTRVTLSAHSGGGSFLFGFVEDGDAIPRWVDRIVFLDANYGFREARGHGNAFGRWLAAPRNHLVVFAYDDREITLNGKRVVGPTGGTWRATGRMFASFERTARLATRTGGDFEVTTALDGRFTAYRHHNPKNAILHTRLVGEMNGLLQGLTIGTKHATAWGTFGGPRAYEAWIQPEPGHARADSIPPRPKGAPGGEAVFAAIAKLALEKREARILAEIERGNVPAFLREPVTLTFRAVDTRGAKHRVALRVAPDSLAIGSERDFVRVPLTPMAAQRVADRYGFALPTRRIVDLCFAHATVKLAPKPMTQAREAATTFLRHNALIEKQRRKHRLGPLVVGAKKDVVITPAVRAGRVAIYGWHRPGGKPIQPLYTRHAATYVDYSHGIRLVWPEATVDGRETTVAAILADPVLHPLLSDEGPIPRDRQRYPR